MIYTVGESVSARRAVRSVGSRRARPAACRCTRSGRNRFAVVEKTLGEFYPNLPDGDYEVGGLGFFKKIGKFFKKNFKPIAGIAAGFIPGVGPLVSGAIDRLGSGKGSVKGSQAPASPSGQGAFPLQAGADARQIIDGIGGVLRGIFGGREPVGQPRFPEAQTPGPFPIAPFSQTDRPGTFTIDGRTAAIAAAAAVALFLVARK